MIKQIHIEGYRSIRELSLPLHPVNVLVGPNGCGKTNLYRALLLLSKAAKGEFASSIIYEGGMPLALWAGEKRHSDTKRTPRRIKLAVSFEELSYELHAGLTPKTPANTCFEFDPVFREEYVWLKAKRRQNNTLLTRKATSVWLTHADRKRYEYPVTLLPSESVLSQLQEPHLYPELFTLRELLLQWRFYHYFDTGPPAAVRQPQVGTLTPVLSHNGNDLAAALQTIIETGDESTLHEIIETAFPDSRLLILPNHGRFAIYLQKDGIRRPFEARELSDGTLRFLCLTAALLSPRPPSLLALNEPETSLHPDLLPALTLLIGHAAKYSQLFITTHSYSLAEVIADLCNTQPIILEMLDGETRWVNEPIAMNT
ncbi:AAA family ATPase [Zooshikella marina]|nr:AAA family ATPase [Zooshikella ganghwensis]MBU2706665.1 AAA family ATPase [Zooshikella ganghwensis]